MNFFFNYNQVFLLLFHLDQKHRNIQNITSLKTFFLRLLRVSFFLKKKKKYIQYYAYSGVWC